MKLRSILPFLSLLAAGQSLHATTIYSGIQNIPIPLNFEGVYLRIDTGGTSLTMPEDWDRAPWLNPFFGGMGIGNSGFLRPVVAGSDQVVNLAAGTVINGSSNFAAGESGSSTHAGPGLNQFAIGVPGYFGAVFNTSLGGEYYGWIQLELNNAGAGKIISWAYEDVSGSSIEAGAISAVPESSTAFCAFALWGLMFAAKERRHLLAAFHPGKAQRER